jgi:hypothetical protein
MKTIVTQDMWDNIIDHYKIDHTGYVLSANSVELFLRLVSCQWGHISRRSYEEQAKEPFTSCYSYKIEFTDEEKFLEFMLRFS